MIAYCEADPGRDDVAALWRQIPAQPEEVQEVTRSQEVVGFVYLTKSGRFYKIARQTLPVGESKSLHFSFRRKLRQFT